MQSKIRIGNAGGFWGDDLGAMRRQLEGGPLDYISIDFLAEITMSILRKQQLKNPAMGYVADFLDQIRENAALIYEKKVKILTNAGGINPLECGRQIVNELRRQSIPLKVAVVEGDNIYDRLDELTSKGIAFKNLETGVAFSRVKNRIQSANAYLGLMPLVKALEAGADIVVAGRVTDTSITMAPMVYAFGWAPDDWDKLAAALVAGHIVECGTQATGGNFTDWEKVPSFRKMGYPIIEMESDGDFVITKHPDTGGMVTVDTVREQLVYEMGDPAVYISPDVVADFSSFRLSGDGTDRVRVSGVKGHPSTPFLKVSMAYEDGFVSAGSVIVSGPRALDKAGVFEEIFWERHGVDFGKKHTSYQGYNACHHSLAPKTEPNEVLLTFSVYDSNPALHKIFARSIAPLILSGPPGVAATGGRPRMSSVLTYWPALIPKDEVVAITTILNDAGEADARFRIPAVTGFESADDISPSVCQVALPEEIENECKDAVAVDFALDGIQQTVSAQDHITNAVRVKLGRICLARSGDKGDTANIGLLARSPEVYRFIRGTITAKWMKTMFMDVCKGKVIRYELDNLMALNFLLEESLDGGGTRSLLTDPQGKTFAQALLNVEILVPASLLQNL